jgi:hypothetical protein
MKKDKKSSKNTKKNKTNKTAKYYPKKYIPSYLSQTNAQILKQEIDKSQLFYNKKNPKYYIRKKVKTMKIKPSKHVSKAKKLYKISNLTINKELSRKTGCSIIGLNKIMKKGQGAYFTGSRPGQTPTSWGYARLASAITGGKSSAIDFHILQSHCNQKTSKAYKLALKAKSKHGKGTRRVPKRLI